MPMPAPTESAATDDSLRSVIVQAAASGSASSSCVLAPISSAFSSWEAASHSVSAGRRGRRRGQRRGELDAVVRAVLEAQLLELEDASTIDGFRVAQMLDKLHRVAQLIDLVIALLPVRAAITDHV